MANILERSVIVEIPNILFLSTRLFMPGDQQQISHSCPLPGFLVDYPTNYQYQPEEGGHIYLFPEED